jgi:hypothetical protein
LPHPTAALCCTAPNGPKGGAEHHYGTGSSSCNFPWMCISSACCSSLHNCNSASEQLLSSFSPAARCPCFGSHYNSMRQPKTPRHLVYKSVAAEAAGGPVVASERPAVQATLFNCTVPEPAEAAQGVPSAAEHSLNSASNWSCIRAINVGQSGGMQGERRLRLYCLTSLHMPWRSPVLGPASEYCNVYWMCRHVAPVTSFSPLIGLQ